MVIDGLVNAISNFILFGAVLILRKSLSNEGLDAFLIHVDRKGLKLFCEGLIVGALLIGLYAVVVVLLGSGQFIYDGTRILESIIVIIANGIGFLGVALFEEALFRGYIFLKLLKKVPMIIAAILSSLLFGMIHIFNYSSSPNMWVAIINAVLIGFLLCILTIKSGSLMLPIGYHLAWNLTEKILLSEKGGMVHLFTPGGNTESEYLITAILLVMSLYVFFRIRTFPKKAKHILQYADENPVN